MKNLFDKSAAEEVKLRIARLSPESKAVWGKMGPAQTLEHCSRSLEMAFGEKTPPRMAVGRVIGWIIKPKVVGNDEPLRRNSPTVPALVVDDKRDLETERARLRGLIDRFTAGGSGACTAHPHSFFGRLTGQEWAILMYKHLDHHLRQFGA